MSNDDQDREMRLANFEKQMRLCSKISNFIIEQTRITDRELLELAAKAAGVVAVDGHYWIARDSSGEPNKWNPLTDDGDALRLAVKLLLTVEVEDGFTEVLTGSGMEITESHKEDSLLATRRAIVRAAAEIGRAMK